MTSTAPHQSPALSARASARPLAWAILWLLLALLEMILLINNARMDTHVWLSTRNFLASLPPVTPLWRFFRFFGNPWCTAALAILLFIISRRRFLIVPTLIAATALAGGIGGLLAIIAGRFRPVPDGANDWVLFRGFHSGVKNLSFPSGHATLAFATAAVLVYFFPKTKWLALPLAAACAFSRIAQQAHFYSDILMGAVLGWTVAWWTARLIHHRFDSSQLTRK